MQSLAEAFQHALALQRDGKLELAIAAYQQLLAQYPDHLATHYNLGCLFATLQRWQEAIPELEYVILREPQCTPAHYNLAICYQAIDQEQAAQDCLEQTLTLDPQHALAQQALGSLLLKQKRFEEAKNYLTAALQSAPQDTDILFNLGLALLSDGDPIGALYHFTKLRELKPHFFEASYNCGVIYQDAGNYPAALRAYDQVLHYNPAHFASLYNSGLICQATQQYPSALKFYQRALAVDPENTSLKFLIAATTESSLPSDEKFVPQAHVKNLFDQYAGHYDRHMQQELKYTVPQQLYDLFSQHISVEPQLYCLVDLGCGTGLVGQYFKPCCHTLIGVDVSPKMLSQAANKYYYTTVTQQDNLEYLNKVKNDVNIIVAADVLGYYGDLQPLFQAALHALCAGGYFLFSIEIHISAEDYLLAPHARFTHHPDYIERLITQLRFSKIASLETILRYQQQMPVKGRLYLLSSPD